MSSDILSQLQSTTPEPGAVFEYFDRLPPVQDRAMLGQFRGEGPNTGHPTDGTLERFGWYGKSLLSEEQVPPMLFHAGPGRVVSLNPGLMPMEMGLRVPSLNNGFTAAVFRGIRPLLQTRRPWARLREVVYRGGG